MGNTSLDGDVGPCGRRSVAARGRAFALGPVLASALLVLLAGGSGEAAVGDANLDSAINVLDVQVVIQAALGATPVSPETDLDGSGVVDVLDVQSSINLALGLPVIARITPSSAGPGDSLVVLCGNIAPGGLVLEVGGQVVAPSRQELEGGVVVELELMLPATLASGPATIRLSGPGGLLASATVTVVGPPLAPAALAVLSASAGGIALEWADRATNEDGYRVLRRTASTSLQTIATLPPGSTQHLDSSAAAGVTYTYVVEAFNASGAARSGPVDATITVTTFRVEGLARYEDRAPDPVSATLPTAVTLKPIRRATVSVRSGASTVASAETDDSGQFAFDLPLSLLSTSLTVRVAALSSGPLGAFHVEDNSAAIYRLDSASFTGPQSGLQLIAPAFSAGLGGAFNIFDQSVRCHEWVRDRDPAAVFPPLRLSWTEGAFSNLNQCTCLDITFPGGQTEYLITLQGISSDPDEYDDSVILHEHGHYVQSAFFRDSSPGGSHFGCTTPPQDLDPRLAFSEGFATAFAQLVLGDPIYVDTMVGGGFTLDIESPTLCVSGVGSEDSCSALVYDLWDGVNAGLASSDGDPFDLGPAAFWAAMIGTRPLPHSTIQRLHEVLTGNGTLTTVQWNAGAAGLGLSAPFAPFPAQSLPLNGTVSGSLDASLQQDSLAAASAFFAITTTTTGTLTVTVQINNAGANDLDLFVYEDMTATDPLGGLLDSSLSVTATEQVVLPNLPPGTYIIQVNAWEGQAGQTQAGFTVTTSFP